MKLEIISPQGVVLSKEVTQVSLPGSMGEFTMLRNHAPIITTLCKGKISYCVNDTCSEFEVSWAVLSANNNNICIYTESYAG